MVLEEGQQEGARGMCPQPCSCFYCQELGHIKWNCPKLISQMTPGGSHPNKPDNHKEQSEHIFTISIAEAETSHDVIGGTVSFTDRNVFVSINSEATQIFIFTIKWDSR